MGHHSALFLILAGLFFGGSPVSAQGTGGASGKACVLLTRDLATAAAPESRKATMAREKPIDDPFAKEMQAAGQSVPRGTTCKYGPVLLVLQPLPQPAQARSALQARTAPYQAFEAVPGVGEAAFFRANSSTASMYVWSGSQHFLVEIVAGFMDDASALKPNAVTLAKGIASQLR